MAAAAAGAGLTAPGPASRPRAPPPRRPRYWPRLLRPPPGSSSVHGPGGRRRSLSIGLEDTLPAHSRPSSQTGERRLRSGSDERRVNIERRLSRSPTASTGYPCISGTPGISGWLRNQESNVNSTVNCPYSPVKASKGENQIGMGQALTRRPQNYELQQKKSHRPGSTYEGSRGALYTRRFDARSASVMCARRV